MSNAQTTLGALMRDGRLYFNDGYRTKRSEHADDGFRIVRAGDVADGSISLDGPDFVSEQFVSAIGEKVGAPGDIVLTTKGSVGRVGVMPQTGERAVYSPQLCFFRVRDIGSIDAGFLRYWFQSDEFLHQAADRMNNTDMAAYINLADIRSLRISLPASGEQQAIAEVLGALDDKIAANGRLQKSATQLCLALVEAHTERCTVADLASLSKMTVQPDEMTDPLVAHFSLPAFDAAGGPEVVSPTTIRSGKFSIRRSSVLISKLNPRFPRVWNIPEMRVQPALASTEFLVLEPRGVSTSALWATLLQPSFGQYLESMVAGTSGSHQRVRPADIMASPVTDARSLESQRLESLNAAALLVHRLTGENTTLAATRDALLPQLMSGKLRVREAEKKIEELV